MSDFTYTRSSTSTGILDGLWAGSQGSKKIIISTVNNKGIDLSWYLERWADDATKKLNIDLDLTVYLPNGDPVVTTVRVIDITFDSSKLTFDLEEEYTGPNETGYELMLELGLKAQPAERICGGYELFEVDDSGPTCTNGCTFVNTVTGRQFKFSNLQKGNYEVQFEGPNERYQVVWDTPSGDCEPDKIEILNRVDMDGKRVRLEDYGKHPPSINFDDLYVVATHGSYEWAGGDYDPVFYNTTPNGDLCKEGYVCAEQGCERIDSTGDIDVNDLLVVFDPGTQTSYRVRAGDFNVRTKSSYQLAVSRGGELFKVSALGCNVEDDDLFAVYRPSEDRVFNITGATFKDEFTFRGVFEPIIESVGLTLADPDLRYDNNTLVIGVNESSNSCDTIKESTAYITSYTAPRQFTSNYWIYVKEDTWAEGLKLATLKWKVLFSDQNMADLPDPTTAFDELEWITDPDTSVSVPPGTSVIDVLVADFTDPHNPPGIPGFIPLPGVDMTWRIAAEPVDGEAQFVEWHKSNSPISGRPSSIAPEYGNGAFGNNEIYTTPNLRYHRIGVSITDYNNGVRMDNWSSFRPLLPTNVYEDGVNKLENERVEIAGDTFISNSLGLWWLQAETGAAIQVSNPVALVGDEKDWFTWKPSRVNRDVNIIGIPDFSLPFVLDNGTLNVTQTGQTSNSALIAGQALTLSDFTGTEEAWSATATFADNDFLKFCFSNNADNVNSTNPGALTGLLQSESGSDTGLRYISIEYNSVDNVNHTVRISNGTHSVSSWNCSKSDAEARASNPFFTLYNPRYNPVKYLSWVNDGDTATLSGKPSLIPLPGTPTRVKLPSGTDTNFPSPSTVIAGVRTFNAFGFSDWFKAPVLEI